MFDAAGREAEIRGAEDRIAELCGVLNATAAALVDQIAHALDGGLWEGAGIRSPEHWVMLHCGVSPARASWLVRMARRLRELPETKASFEAGALSEDQVKLVARHAPTYNDAEVAELARHCTVPQLRRTLSSYAFAEPRTVNEAPPEHPPGEVRRVGFGFDDDGSWRLYARLPADEGALVEKALGVSREDLYRRQGEAQGAEVTWADALVAVADVVLASRSEGRPSRDRYLTLLHVETDTVGSSHGRVHLGPALPTSLRRHLTCDGQVRPIHQLRGVPVSVGRRRRIVPDRTRVAVEDRDRGCRVPGCASRRWTEVHHLVHWEDGGATDTSNLVLLCGPHHRMHHGGRLGIAGDADDPDGLAFTDEHGHPLRVYPTPVAPGAPVDDAAAKLGLSDPGWQHASGEHLDGRNIWFREPPAA